MLGFSSKRLLSQIDERLQRLEMLYIVRDPGTALSADAYDSLRKRIASAAKNREQHLVNLAQLDQAARVAADVSVVAGKIEESMQAFGLVRVTRPEHLPDGVSAEEAFDINGSGPRLVIESPAYVEIPVVDGAASRGRVHVQGRAVRDDSQSEPGATENEADQANLEEEEPREVQKEGQL